MKKAFDRVPIEKLWMAMEEYRDLELAIKYTYKTNKSRVSTNGSGEWFTIESDVRQVRMLSPRLWRCRHGDGDQDVYKNNNDVALAFADDIAQTAMNIEKTA